MAPATGYADASSDNVNVRKKDRNPDIGQATSYLSVVSFFIHHNEAAYNHLRSSVLVRILDGEHCALDLSAM
jgi:hypothetical protein